MKIHFLFPEAFNTATTGDFYSICASSLHEQEHYGTVHVDVSLFHSLTAYHSSHITSDSLRETGSFQKQKTINMDENTNQPPVFAWNS